MKRKICVVVTARPSYSRVKSVLTAIKKHSNLELQLIISGTALLDKYGKTDSFIERDGFEITEKVFTVIEGGNLVSMAKTTGIAIMELSTAFEKLQPDAVITIADRYETIATSIASSYMNIPLVHLQGGEITGNIDEKVRHANTKLADIHFVSSNLARDRVIRMGENPDFVFNTGCPSNDIAKIVIDNPELNFNPFNKYSGVGEKFELTNGYIVVMQHPETNSYSKAREQITETLMAVNDLDIPAFWFWPNSDAGTDGTSKGIRAFREDHLLNKVFFFKNMSSEDFLKLINNSKCLVGNSSVGIREASFLGVPTVNIGDRQESRDRGSNVIDVKYDHKEIEDAIIKQLRIGKYQSDPLYGDGYAGEKIADLLANVDLVSRKKLNYS